MNERNHKTRLTTQVLTNQLPNHVNIYTEVYQLRYIHLQMNMVLEIEHQRQQFATLAMFNKCEQTKPQNTLNHPGINKSITNHAIINVATRSLNKDLRGNPKPRVSPDRTGPDRNRSGVGEHF